MHSRVAVRRRRVLSLPSVRQLQVSDSICLCLSLSLSLSLCLSVPASIGIARFWWGCHSDLTNPILGEEAESFEGERSASPEYLVEEEIEEEGPRPYKNRACAGLRFTQACVARPLLS